MTKALTNEKKLKQITANLAAELRPEVQKIEAQPYQSTRGNYGLYLSLLSKHDPTIAGVLASALILAGANRGGVMSALQIVRGD
tara:strand:+ start:92 stop:343 length:252 start_codon:yes stop_codon:yes gene_type:complete